MTYGFCHLAVVPMRKEASDVSEMVSQLLFGEVFQILEQTATNWAKVLTTYDHYEGWIDCKQFLPISHQEHADIAKWKKSVLQILPLEHANRVFHILPGSSLPDAAVFSVNEQSFSVKREQTNIFPTIDKTALLLLNTPYLWGGRSFFGIDCSGFVQLIFGLNGIVLLRDAHLQATQGKAIASLDKIQKNDLLFFSNKNGKIIHVGIYLDENKIIHASGCVRIDSIDEKGIFNHHLRDYTHDLHSIRRMN